ncbi:MAG: MarR family winged helix-turn-helix transcriptional regulator [Thalassovita mediterranea]|jgi:DNA-binding MarR family transcriptional regulator|uniref:MarR family winged helix-turn-helix transcriptional regulator n=1 Tax=Thalassovita mediterranea TaxID=340021 RepID=UPI003C6499AE
MTQTAPFTTLDQQLCFEVYAASHAFTKFYKPLLDPLGLTYPQYLVMLLLWQRDDRAVGDLGQALSLESSTLTPLLKRMEASGQITRQRDPEDERRVRIRLTDAGRALQDQAATIPACLGEAAAMPASEVTELREEVRRLRLRLEAALAG